MRQGAFWSSPAASKVVEPPAWDGAQLNDWYRRRSTFERELYAYFLDVVKAEAGVPADVESLTCASTAAALTIRNIRIRRETTVSPPPGRFPPAASGPFSRTAGPVG